jgi:RHH-type transcriptional regulator, proline utilization regulon repressor / proline dehydrogenase / delta 1-pyrroline-5-carboxylate dehydrogenase
LCMGPGTATATEQARAVSALGGDTLELTGQIDIASLAEGPSYGGILWWGDAETARAIEQALAKRDGPIVPLIRGLPDTAHVRAERHLCVDTTASGGNAKLLGAAG